jgi:hypothetical protein
LFMEDMRGPCWPIAACMSPLRPWTRRTGGARLVLKTRTSGVDDAQRTCFRGGPCGPSYSCRCGPAADDSLDKVKGPGGVGHRFAAHYPPFESRNEKTGE